MIRLEVAALYAAANLFILFALAFRVMLARRSKKVRLGDGGDADMVRRIRAHANAAENIPGALVGILILALLEPAAPAWLLHAAGVSLTVGRLAHGVGLSVSDLNVGRLLGMTLTWVSYLLIIGGLVFAATQQAI